MPHVRVRSNCQIFPEVLVSFASPVSTKKVEPKTPVREKIASTINIYRTPNGRLSQEGWEKVMQDLQDSCIKMSLSGVKKIGHRWWQQKKADVPVINISVARKRKSCGTPTMLTLEITRRMMAIQAENYGNLSCRTLCGKVKDEGMNFAHHTVYGWFIVRHLKC